MTQTGDVNKRHLPLLAIRAGMQKSAKKGSIVLHTKGLPPDDVAGWIGRSSRPASGRGDESSSKTLLSNTDEERASFQDLSMTEMKVERLPYTRYGIVGFIFSNLFLGVVSYFLQQATHSPEVVPLVLASTVWVLSFTSSVIWRYFFVPEDRRSLAKVAFAVSPAFGAIAPAASLTPLCYSAVGLAFITADDQVFSLRTSSPLFFYISAVSLCVFSFASFMFHFTSSLFEAWHRLDRASAVLFAAALSAAASQAFFGGENVSSPYSPYGSAIGFAVFFIVAFLVFGFVIEVQLHAAGMSVTALDCERRAQVDYWSGSLLLLCGVAAIALILVSSLRSPLGPVTTSCPALLAAKWAGVSSIPVVAVFGVLYDVATACLDSIVACGTAILVIVPDNGSLGCGSRVEVALSVSCFLVLGGSLLLGTVARFVGREEARVSYVIVANSVLAFSTAVASWICVA